MVDRASMLARCRAWMASAGAPRTMSHAGPIVRYGPWIVSALLALALLTRFIGLDLRPMQHDESATAYYAYIYFENGRYTHSPIMHGPVPMLAIGKAFSLFGDSITVARALIAAASLVMLAATLALAPRRYRLGLAPLLITSPVLLYYSRFVRGDVLFCAVLMLGLTGFAVALSRRHGPGVRAACAALGAFMFLALTGIMESSAFVYATGVTFLLLLGARRWLRRYPAAPRAETVPAPPSTPRPAAPAARRRWIVGAGWVAGLLLGLAFLAYIYGISLAPAVQDEARRAVLGDAPAALRAVSPGKPDLTWSEQAGVTARLMAGSWRNVKDSWDYWMGQHQQHRVFGPSHYYLPILLIYELPACLLLVAGLIWDACRRDPRLGQAFFRKRRATVYAGACVAWVALWLLWKLASATVAPHWLLGLERFLHLAPDGSALTLGLVITPVLVWSMLSLREGRVLAAWMGWWLACSLFQYSIAGEKVPWLAMHILLPLYLTVVWLWAPRLRRLGRRGTGAAVAIGIVTGASVLALRIDIPLMGSRAADPAERMVFNHTTPWLHQALESRVALWTTMQDTVPLRERRVMLVGHGVWPSVWYVRRLSYQLADDKQEILSVPEGTDLVIGTPEQLAPLLVRAQVGRYMARAGSLREAWIESWPDADRWSRRAPGVQVAHGSARDPSVGATASAPVESHFDLLRSNAVKLWRYYWWREIWTPRTGFPILLVEPVVPRH